MRTGSALTRIAVGLCLGFLLGCAGRTRQARVKEVPNAERIKAVAVEYLKGMWPRSSVQEILPLTLPPMNGEHSVFIWHNTNMPGGFTIIRVSTNLEAVGWRPGQ